MKCVIFFLQVLTPWLQFPTAFTRFLTFTKCIMEYYSAIKKNFYSFFIFFILGLTQSIWVSPNEVDESRAYYTEWSKSERERQILYINTCIWNLEATVRTLYGTTGASLVVHMVKNPPTVLDTWVWSLSWEDPLEEGMATHTSIVAWRVPMDRGTWQAIVHEIAKSWTWPSD